MAKKQFEYHLSRRMLGDNGGWVYFCRVCGVYLPENEFYKSKNTKWGLDSRCKLHHSRKDEDDDGEMNYLKLNPITEDDFIGTQQILERLGYTFTGETVHNQFMKKYKLQ
jgi:hypothetical protein